MVTVSLRGLPTTHLVEACAQTRDDIVDRRLGHQRATDAGAPLTRLGGDLSAHLADEEIEFLGSRNGVGAEDGAVERVGLGIESRGACRHGGMRSQHRGGVCAAGEGDDVLATEVVEQVADTAAHELHGAVGQRTRGDEVADARRR